MLEIRFEANDRDERARQAAALMAASQDWDIIVGANALVILSREQVPSDSSSLLRHAGGSCAFSHGSCVHFDPTARDAVLVTVRGRLATELGVLWDHIDDRDGRIYDALIARITDQALQWGVLRTIQRQVRADKWLKRKRAVDASLRAAVRLLLTDPNSDNADEAVGALIAIGDVAPAIAYWNSPDVAERDPELSVRKAIASALADHGGRDEVELLRSFVADSKLDPALRNAALRALQERRSAGTAARYEREIDDALARRRAAEQQQLDR